MKKKKEQVVILHIICVFLVVIGVSIMYNNTHYGEGISWLTRETYEDTSVFMGQFKSDIDNIFNYMKYKGVFETDGKLDYDRLVVRVVDGPGTTREYTLDEMVRHAKSLGYYLDERFKVNGRPPTPKSDEEQLKVEYRAYEPNFQATGPGDALKTVDELAYEVLSHLGNYYAFHYKFIQNPSNMKFEVKYQSNDSDYKLYTNVSGKSIDELKGLGKYLYITGQDLYVDTNLIPIPQNVSSELEKMNPYNNNNYHMIVAVNTSYPYTDSYSVSADAYNNSRLLFIMGLVSLCMGILGCAITLYFMISMTGHMEYNKDTISLSRIDRIPTEWSLILLALATLFFLLLGKYILYKVIHLFLPVEKWFYGELAIRVLILYAMGTIAVLSLVRRYKANTLWKNSLLRRLLKNLRLYIKNHRFTTRVILFYGSFLLFNMIMALASIFLYIIYDDLGSRILSGAFAVILLCGDLWVFHQLYRNAWETDLINDALLKISGGDTSYQIDTGEFSGKEQELAQNINHIGKGLETALQEKVRSERLKTDLITNVSHDIKTPLTSIINYVDLIKREHIQDPKIQGYLEVLEQKSQRLKTLTEDLVEASKASSGNLKLEMADIDFVELIHQTNGEFEEKFALRHLDMVSSLPDESILIRADGRYLWRVLENLYNNAFKYAMEKSRVYIDIVKDDKKVVFTMKNISTKPLNIHPDELTERFVRGDVARTTEGSGLGLSIAKSLTELQGGTFTVYIDGDLFKAQVAFFIR